MKKALSALLIFTLLLALSPARAAYTDLPAEHWAYATMTEAAQLGILTGGDDGLMYPEAPLSWGQCLLILARTFYAPALDRAPPAKEGVEHWAKPAYDLALAQGVLEQADFLPVSLASLDAAITRQATAVLVDRVLLRVFGAEPVRPDLGAAPLADFSSLPEPYRASVLQCCTRGIIQGTEDGRFLGGDTLTRAGGAALMMRALALVEDAPAGDNVTPPGQTDKITPPDAFPPAPAGDALTRLGSNSEKLLRLYGSDTVTRYSSQIEAEANMVSVTVPVWRLDSGGGKVSSTQTFRTHQAIASDMISIFTAIYNDPEQFPIKDITGYTWRGDSAKGEHNCGTAVDINYSENYQIYPDGTIAAGTLWLPGENPYSIPEDGSVVRIFNAHGYTWGGNGWPSYSNKDYMHFSYLGL